MKLAKLEAKINALEKVILENLWSEETPDDVLSFADWENSSLGVSKLSRQTVYNGAIDLQDRLAKLLASSKSMKSSKSKSSVDFERSAVLKKQIQKLTSLWSIERDGRLKAEQRLRVLESSNKSMLEQLSKIGR